MGKRRLLPCGQAAVGLPIAHDIVEDFPLGRNFDQADSAAPPCALRFDPDAGTAAIKRFEIGKVIIATRALRQPEPARTIIDKRADLCSFSGLASDRQIVSPAPLMICKPSVS